mgnify:CR=1 FL=1
MVKVVKADEKFRLRPMAAAISRERKEAFDKLKEDERALKETYRERLRNLTLAKDELKRCSGENQTGECTVIRAAALARAKEAALHAADRLLNHLNKLKNRIESSENMDESEASGMAVRIDNLIAEVEKIKGKIDAFC